MNQLPLVSSFILSYTLLLHQEPKNGRKLGILNRIESRDDENDDGDEMLFVYNNN